MVELIIRAVHKAHWAGVDPQSAIIKRRGCVYSGICLFLPFPPLDPDAMRFLSYFSTTIPPGDLYTFSSELKRRVCERQKKTRDSERKKERKGGRRWREDDEGVGRITMQLFSFQLVNGF